MIDISAYVDTLILVVMIIMITGLVGGLGLFFIWLKTWNIKARIRYGTNTFDKVKDIKAKYDKKKDKVIFKETLFKRFTMPMPEKECVSLGHDGGDLIEVTIKPDGSKEYIKVTKRDYAKQVHEVLNSKDKIFYLHELEKREQRKKKSLGEILLTLAPLLAIIIIIAMVLSFWGSVMEPFNDRMRDAENFELKMMSHLATTQEGLNEILSKEQIIREGVMNDKESIPD